MEELGLLFHGFAVALSLKNLVLMLIGVVLGVLIGVLPGLGGANGVAILLPLTFSMNPTSAIIMLSCIYWGALFGGVAWTALQGIGSWYTRRLVENADKTYGTFAVVIGLLSWIYLQAQVFVYAAEVSSVSSRRLWPRALDAERPTDADAAVARAIVERSRPAQPGWDAAQANNESAS